jgi:hypothetical protein
MHVDGIAIHVKMWTSYQSIYLNCAYMWNLWNSRKQRGIDGSCLVS